MKRSVSLTLDADLLARAERLSQPNENRSALIERLLEHGIRQAEDARLDADYARAFPPDFEWPAEQRAAREAVKQLAGKHLRRRLGRSGDV